jgi:outer membrane receptor protein involved in Fe transport
MDRIRHFCLWLGLLVFSWISVWAGGNGESGEIRKGWQQARLEPLTVSALRGLQPMPGGVFEATAFDAIALNQSVYWTADDFLRQIPGFSLFRRTSSLVANPTTQGASLRGIGPSGASRSLVLFDGVPLNDPFGGWVYWSLLNLRQAERVEVVRGGGSAAWGNTALGGVIQIVPRHPQASTLEAQVSIGNQGTWETSVYGSERIGSLGLAVEARAFSTDGYKRVRADQRGDVDIRSNARHEVIHLLADYVFPTEARFSVRGTIFDERRGNGTPLTNNSTESFRLHLKLESDASAAFAWQVDAYGVDSEYASTFSSVSADRNSEVLVLDQYAVPSTALGGGWRGTWRETEIGAITVGTDWLGVQGRTQERVVFAGDDRLTGGRQLLGGIYAEHDWEFAEAWRWQAGLRLDYWRNYRGFEDQPNTARQEFSSRERYIVNSRAGVSREIDDTLVLRSAIYQAFRVPTINELYRPFQVGADLTQANAALDPERLLGVEMGLDYAPTPTIELRNTVFYNTVKNPILNVTVGTTAGGGQLRQRRNIEETRIYGWESELRVRPAPEWSAFLRYALTDARVQQADDQPALVGRRLAQVPRHVATLGMTHQWLQAGPEISAQARWSDAQFEDDLNLRRLGSYPLVSITLQQRVGEHGSLFVGVENLLDRRYPDGITGNGLITEGRPRSYQAGIRLKF